MGEIEKKSEEIVQLKSNQVRSRLKEIEVENVAYRHECQRLRTQLEDLLAMPRTHSD